MNTIEQTHQSNFDRIETYNLRVGTRLKHKEKGHIIEITHIHSTYGWVTCKSVNPGTIVWSSKLKQDMSNISEFDILLDENICPNCGEEKQDKGCENCEQQIKTYEEVEKCKN